MSLENSWVQFKICFPREACDAGEEQRVLAEGLPSMGRVGGDGYRGQNPVGLADCCYFFIAIKYTEDKIYHFNNF